MELYPNQKDILNLPTKRLVAWWKVHRRDAITYQISLEDQEGYLGIKARPDEWDRVAELEDFLMKVKDELNKREHVV